MIVRLQRSTRNPVLRVITDSRFDRRPTNHMHEYMYIESKGTGLGFRRIRDVRFSKFVYDDLPKTDIVIITSISPWIIQLTIHAHGHRKSFVSPSTKLPPNGKVTKKCPDLPLDLNPVASLSRRGDLPTELATPRYKGTLCENRSRCNNESRLSV